MHPTLFEDLTGSGRLERLPRLDEAGQHRELTLGPGDAATKEHPIVVISHRDDDRRVSPGIVLSGVGLADADPARLLRPSGGAASRTKRLGRMPIGDPKGGGKEIRVGGRQGQPGRAEVDPALTWWLLGGYHGDAGASGSGVLAEQDGKAGGVSGSRRAPDEGRSAFRVLGHLESVTAQLQNHRLRIGEQPPEGLGLLTPVGHPLERGARQSHRRQVGPIRSRHNTSVHEVQLRRACTAYRGTVSPSPAFLAALASIAVPGLDPVAVRAVQTDPLSDTALAFVTDAVERRWVVRCPLTEAAGARLDAAASVARPVADRLSIQVPVPSGFADVDAGRAAVSPLLPGSPLDLAALPAGPGLAGHLGRVLADIHALDRRIVEESGMPVYDADTLRAARLADLDRGASTGHVPAKLLERWERALDDVTLWRFAPTVVHGSLTGSSILATFDDVRAAASGSLAAILGWGETHIGDPADDFADAVSAASPEAVDSVIEAYANARVEGVDPHLRRRALVAAEFRMLRRLLVAVTVDDPDQVRWHAARLRRLAEDARDNDFAPESPAVVTAKPTVIPVAPEVLEREAEAERHTQGWDAAATQEFTSPTIVARESAAEYEPLPEPDEIPGSEVEGNGTEQPS